VTTNKIALIVDSCTDVPPAQIKQYGMFELPLWVNFKDGAYRDRIDITPEEVLHRLETEIPKTSLPSPQEIKEVFKRAINNGFTKAVVVTISSGLSGTYETVRMVGQQTEGLDCTVVDTKNIGLGAGFTAIAAGELISQGVPFEKMAARLAQFAKDTKVFFSVKTLDYLKAGGRIGEVTYLMGNLMDIKPVISCNSKGVYYTAKNARGRKAALKKMVELAQNATNGFSHYNVAVMHSGAKEKAQEILDKVKELFPGAVRVFEGQISPALVVHTGPGLVGISIQGLE
jgi:DegV family protein with EDD domain